MNMKHDVSLSHYVEILNKNTFHDGRYVARIVERRFAVPKEYEEQMLDESILITHSCGGYAAELGFEKNGVHIWKKSLMCVPIMLYFDTDNPICSIIDAFTY